VKHQETKGFTNEKYQKQPFMLNSGQMRKNKFVTRIKQMAIRKTQNQASSKEPLLSSKIVLEGKIDNE
jgi:hypothetical protein